jgi:hypothetical protein
MHLQIENNLFNCEANQYVKSHCSLDDMTEKKLKKTKADSKGYIFSIYKIYES